MPRSSKLTAKLKRPFVSLKTHVQGFMARRPHRSFQLTRRRDYHRSLQLPGFLGFTGIVNKMLWSHRKTFIILIAIYAVLTTVLIGIGSQDNYATLTSTLQDTGSEVFEGNFAELGKAGLLFVSIAGSGLTEAPSDSQQIYTVIIGLMVWLVTVWLLRNMLAGHKVRLRDGMYSAGAPIVSTFLVGLLMIVQLLPLGLAVIGYSAATASGLLAGGVEAMLFWFAAALLTVLSLYWITSTFFAMIIVTLPGMYPMKAIKAAGDMVVGRRLRILLRLLWMVLCIGVAWVVVLIPLILIDSGIKHFWTQIDWVPIIPVALLLLGVASVVWGASYVYLLYRRVVDDDAKPA